MPLPPADPHPSRPVTAPAPRQWAWAAALVAAAAAVAPALADPPAPLFQQLSDETQRMYAHARLGMVRVRLPTPPWLARQNQRLLAKWGALLDPAVREQILEARERAARPRSTTGPALAWPATGPGLTVTVVPAPDRVLVATGLLVDSAGHAVFPLYVDRSDLGDGADLPALTGDGRPTVAAFVGSDRITNLSVFKLADAGAHPAVLDVAGPVGRPPDGSLALVVAADGAAHLSVWSPAAADTGLVLRPDGTFAGFGFADDFLPVATARPIVDQLVATGTVRRPSLGMIGQVVRRSDLFADPATPAGPAAIRVSAVDADSAADRAGLRPADVILAIGGQSVGPRTFAAVITARRGPTPLRVRRGNQTLNLTLDLPSD